VGAVDLSTAELLALDIKREGTSEADGLTASAGLFAVLAKPYPVPSGVTSGQGGSW
jgi:hypothetical protein